DPRGAARQAELSQEDPRQRGPRRHRRGAKGRGAPRGAPVSLRRARLPAPAEAGLPLRDMTMRWDVAGGSTIGRDHARAGRNNQAGFATGARAAAAAAVVGDGWGGALRSEWGAVLGARLTAGARARRADAPWDRLWPEVQGEVLAGLRAAAAL